MGQAVTKPGKQGIEAAPLSQAPGGAAANWINNSRDDMRNTSFNPEFDLDRYYADIRRYPLLSREEEIDLSRRWQDGNDEAALDKLVGSHLRLVAKVARSYSGYGLPLADLISEGNVGLVRAAEKFDPDRGFRFSTYAGWWIRAAIQEYVLYSWSLVKIGTTAAQKKLFFNLRRVKAELKKFEDGDLDPDAVSAIAERLNVTETEVVEMNRRLTGGDFSLNETAHEDGEEWINSLKDQGPGPDATVADLDELDWRRSLMQDGLETLNERERRILKARRLVDEPRTLQNLSEEYGISRERVRQIEGRAIERLRNAMLQAAAEANTKNSAAGGGECRPFETA